MDDQATVGARLRVLRRWRGMTLAEVAGLAGVTASWLSMVERGLRPIDRRSHIAAISSALRVSESDLVGGPHLSADPVQAEPHSTIPAVRAALLTNTLTSPAVERARPLPELVAEMSRIDHSEYKFLQVGQRLPAVIDELHVHVAAPADEAAYRLALETLIEAFQTATFTSKDLGYVDLAHIAASRALEVAGILDDPISKGKADSLRIHTMPVTSWPVTLTTAETAADAIESHIRDDLGAQVAGMLTLAAALSAAVARRYDRTEHWLAQAGELAERVPDSPRDNWGAFSRTNVAVWRISLAVERGDGGPVMLDLAKEVNENRIAGRPGRRATFLADVGRGLARERRTRDQAVRWLRRAEDVAPHKIRNSSPVRETVASTLTQAISSAGGRELRGLASRMGIAH